MNLCRTCSIGLERFVLGCVNAILGVRCDRCEQPAVYGLPYIPPWPGPDNSLQRAEDGSLYWRGQGLGEPPGEQGEPGIGIPNPAYQKATHHILFTSQFLPGGCFYGLSLQEALAILDAEDGGVYWRGQGLGEPPGKEGET